MVENEKGYLQLLADDAIWAESKMGNYLSSHQRVLLAALSAVNAVGSIYEFSEGRYGLAALGGAATILCGYAATQPSLKRKR